ncbi:MAG: hypothetical protein WKG07_26530, partial [Hymenobacter sp.]
LPMKAVILAGGVGTPASARRRTVRPKPMIEIGGKPILWHIMKIYSAHGDQRLRDLPRLQGLRDQGVLRQLLPAHVRRDVRHRATTRCDVHQRTAEPWQVTLVDTGEDTMTGGRLKRVLRYVGRRGLLPDLRRRRGGHRHRRARRASIASSGTPGHGYRRPAARALRSHGRRAATASVGFREKPEGDGGWINGGFFVLSPRCRRLHRGRRQRLGARAVRAPGPRGAARCLSASWLLAGRWTPFATRTSSSSCGSRGGRRGRRGRRPRLLAWPRESCSPATRASRAAGCASGSRPWAPRWWATRALPPRTRRCTSSPGSARA